MSFKKVFNAKTKAGSRESREPRLLGSIVEEMLHGNSSLAKGYRLFIASLENGEAADHQGWHPNTELSVDVKTLLRSDRRMKAGKEYLGVLRRDSEAQVEEFHYCDPHYTFVETLPLSTKRNPQVFNGQYITITRRDDGSLRPNFKPLRIDEDFTVDGYAIGVCNELRQALNGLVEK